jgi:nicotinate-nucleotide adenylyltransferase
VDGTAGTTRESGLRTAIFGGAFDPVHKGHLLLARAATGRVNLDRVLLVPAVNPPHKHMIADYEDRFRMLELAVGGDPVLRASRLDAGRPHSYSIETIERLREQAPDANIFFLIGADAFAEIRTWVRWPEVIAAVEFIVASRPGYSYEVPEAARVHRMDWFDLPVSSSEIRARLSQGESPEELPPGVLDYIQARRLYRR